MKKTCNDCRALKPYGCGLNYRTEITRFRGNNYSHDRAPLENCPKPKTYKDLLYHFKLKQQNEKT